MKSLTFLYSGEGSQYLGMGLELYEKNAAFREAVLRGDEILRARGFDSVAETIYPAPAPPKTAFDHTPTTHPAIFLVQYALTQALAAEGITPARVLGYSLGELVAATVAGFFSLEEGLGTCAAQGKVFQDYTPEALMLAVLGPKSLIDENAAAFDGTWLAGANYAENFVVTGPKAAIERAAAFLATRKIVAQKLPVSRGFHSPLVEPAHAAFAGLHRASPRQCSGAVEFLAAGLGGTRQDLLTGDYFWKAAREPVLFHSAIEALEKQGPRTYVDLGPSGTLGGFVKRILGPSSTSRIHLILSPFVGDAERLKKTIDALR